MQQRARLSHSRRTRERDAAEQRAGTLRLRSAVGEPERSRFMKRDSAGALLIFSMAVGVACSESTNVATGTEGGASGYGDATTSGGDASSDDSASSGDANAESGASDGDGSASSDDANGDSGEASGDGGGRNGGFPTTGTVLCGTSVCAPSLVCCVVMVGGGAGDDAGGSSCANPGDCPSGTVPVACSSAKSCAGGGVCCFGARGGGGGRAGGGDGPTCQSSCAGGTQLCESDSECLDGSQCTPFGGGGGDVDGGIGICRTPGGTFGSYDGGGAFDAEGHF